MMALDCYMIIIEKDFVTQRKASVNKRLPALLYFLGHIELDLDSEPSL